MHVEYALLADLYEKLEATSKRLEKTVLVGDFLREHSNSENLIYLIQGKVFADWDKRKLGVASKLLIKAMSFSTGVGAEKIEDKWREIGDIGEVAEALMKRKSQATLFSAVLTVEKVHRNLEKLASLEGEGTVQTKVQLVAELLSSASAKEAKYIIRTIIGDMRVGLGEGVMRDAVVWAFAHGGLGASYDAKKNQFVFEDGRSAFDEAVRIVEEGFNLTNDFFEVAHVLRTKGLAAVQNISLVAGKPMKVMLYPKCDGIADALETVGSPAACEYKFDGFRLQIHKKGEQLWMFTRRLEEVSEQFPDVAKSIREAAHADSFIIDCEAVGIDKATGRYLAFQNISQRIKRKYDIAELAALYPVEVNVFDVMLVDSEDVTQRSLEERRKILQKVVKKKGIVRVIDQLVSGDAKEIDKYYQQALECGNEGLMIKNLQGKDRPGKRVGYGVKLKPVMETLDLVVIGGEWGEGKRSSWISSFIVACRDAEGNLIEVGRVATGLKEKDEEGFSFGQMTELLKPLILEQKGKQVRVSPAVVIEIAFEEIQKSPTYSSGFALRFPRFLRLRSDRSVEDVSDLDLVKSLYKKQRGRA